jgi:predicted RNA-binding Zn-ribbon protein involved in translation (DUF1610 family)
MAQCIRFVCPSCDNAIEAWSDGNPYYFDMRGEEKYAHHPDHKHLDLCIGNDRPHVCLSCGEQFVVDSREPIASCPKCEFAEIADAFNLDGKRCPACKKDVFPRDANFDCIS